MWKNNSDDDDSDGDTRKRKRETEPSSSDERGRVIVGGSPSISSNLTTEETVEAIMRCELSFQPATPSCSAPLCCALSGDEGSQSFCTSYYDLADLGQGSLPSSYQQSLTPSVDDVDEWMNAIIDHPGYGASSAAFP